MALRRDFLNYLVRLARDLDRVNKSQTQAQRKEFQELQRAYQVYNIEGAQFPADIKNLRLRFKLHVLKNLLHHTLEVDDYISFDSLKLRPRIPDFTVHIPVRSLFIPPEPLNYKWLSKTEQLAYQKAVEVAELKYQAHVNVYMQEQIKHKEAVKRLLARTRAQQQMIDRFQQEFEQGDPESIVNYFHIVLMASTYPNGFPQHAKLAYVKDNQQLWVEYDLPPIAIVPENKAYRPAKTGKGISYTTFSQADRRSMYASAIAQITLRTIHELFESDRIEHLRGIVFNGYVEAIDPTNGHSKRVCVVTIETTHEAFLNINLAQVDPVACLNGLGGVLSRKIDEPSAVEPVRDFETLNTNWIEETDTLSELDTRLDLMSLDSSQFETVISDLIEKMGLEIIETTHVQDQYWDYTLSDPRPILGGKVVIQVQRVIKPVDDDAIGHLLERIQKADAYKGILLTTSDYTPSTSMLAQGKPIELLNSSNLLYLLKEHAGIDAKIIPPEAWVDDE